MLHLKFVEGLHKAAYRGRMQFINGSSQSFSLKGVDLSRRVYNPWLLGSSNACRGVSTPIGALIDHLVTRAACCALRRAVVI